MGQKLEDKLITAEELGHLKIEEPYELVKGRIVKMSPAGMWHGIILGHINALVSEYVARKNLGMVTSGETGYRVRRNPDSVRAPDLAFVSHATLARAQKAAETFFPCAPDLAIEVLSPDDVWEKVEEKVREYLSAEGKLVWVVSPKGRTVYVYEPGVSGRVLGAEDEITGGEVLPGFRSRVASFFGAV